MTIAVIGDMQKKISQRETRNSTNERVGNSQRAGMEFSSGPCCGLSPLGVFLGPLNVEAHLHRPHHHQQHRCYCCFLLRWPWAALTFHPSPTTCSASPAAWRSLVFPETPGERWFIYLWSCRTKLKPYSTLNTVLIDFRTTESWL